MRARSPSRSLARLALALSVPTLAACGAREREGDLSSVLREFVGRPVEAVTGAGPIDVGMRSMTGERILDTIFALGVIGALIGLGYMIKRAAEPRFRPFLFAGFALIPLVWGFANPLHWQYAGAVVDEEGITVRRHAAADLSISWSRVERVRVGPGRPFPLFADDRSLVLEDAEGNEVRLPRFSPGAEDIAAFVGKKLLPADARSHPRTTDPEDDMSSEVPEQARGQLEAANRLLDGLLTTIDDESLPAMERMAAVASVGGEIEKHLQAAMASGLSQDHPAVLELIARGDAIGPKLEALAAAGAVEVATPPPPSSSEHLGREAAGLELKAFRTLVDRLESRPGEAEALEIATTVRDEAIRGLWEMGRRRAALDQKGQGDFQWGLINAQKDAKELRGLIGGDLWAHYQDTPVRAVLEELLGVIRYLDEAGLSDAERACLDRLGLR